MEEASRRAWLAFVQAEQAYWESMGELREIDLIQTLREGLAHAPWRRPALAVLRASNVAYSVQLLPELFDLAGEAHSMLSEVRRCIRRIPKDVLERELPALLDRLIAGQESDDEAYRRTAELLRLLELPSLLAFLVSAASASADPDIREVAEDFRDG